MIQRTKPEGEEANLPDRNIIKLYVNSPVEYKLKFIAYFQITEDGKKKKSNFRAKKYGRCS